MGRAPWNGRLRRPTAIPPPAQTSRPTLPRFSGRSGRRESFIFPPRHLAAQAGDPRLMLPQPRPPRSFLPCSRLSGQTGGREGRLPAPAPAAPAAGPFRGPARELVRPPPAAQLAGGRDPARRCSRIRAPRNRRPRPQLPRLQGRGAPRWEGGCFGSGRRTCSAGGARPAWGGRRGRESLSGRHGNGAAISSPRVVLVARCQGARVWQDSRNLLRPGT